MLAQNSETLNLIFFWFYECKKKKNPNFRKLPKFSPCLRLSVIASCLQTSELLWQSCILTTNMGSVLTDPFTTSCTPSLHPSITSFFLDFSTNIMVTMMRTVSSSPTSAPTTVTRSSFSSSVFSSLGSDPFGNNSDAPTRRLVRSSAMCMMFVPRLLSSPMSRATSGSSLLADLLERRLLLLRATLLPGETSEWYSRLRFPIPRLAFSLERTVYMVCMYHSRPAATWGKDNKNASFMK